MTKPGSGPSRKPKSTVRAVALGLGLGWGPGVIAAIVVGVLTKSVGFAVLTFAVITAIGAVVLGAIGSVMMKRREERSRRS